MGNVEGNLLINSYESYLKVENQTTTRIINTEISDIWNRDWDGNGRPDHNFHGVSIAAGATLTHREELNARAGGGLLTMKLIFENGLVDTFSICQKYAVDKCTANFNHSIRSHDIFYQREGDKTLKITIKNTQQQLNNEKAEQLSKEAKNHSTQEQFSQALEKFDAALNLANEQSTIQNLKTDKSEICFEMGKISMENGCKLESQLQSDEAINEFNNAKLHFGNAQNLGFVNCKLNMDVLNAKIDGSRLFNEAVILEEKALNLCKENQSTHDNILVDQIKNNYEQALNKYEQAKKIFEHGAQLNDQMFAESIQIVNGTIGDVKQSIEEATSTELLVNFGNMYLNNAKKMADGDQEEQTVNIYKQIE